MTVRKRLCPLAVPMIGSVWIILGAVLLGLGALELYWAAPVAPTAPTTGAAAYVSEDLTHEGIRWSAYLGGGVIAAVGVVGLVAGVCFVARLPGSRAAIELLTWLSLASVPGFMMFLGWRAGVIATRVGSENWALPVLGGLLGVLPVGLLVAASLGLMIYHLRRYDVAEVFSRPEACRGTH